MRNKYHALRNVLITALLMGIMPGVTDSAEADLTEQTIQAIENCMARSPGERPDEWRQDYFPEGVRTLIRWTSSG